MKQKYKQQEDKGRIMDIRPIRSGIVSRSGRNMITMRNKMTGSSINMVIMERRRMVRIRKWKGIRRT